jgi:hypothetical protein
MEADILFFSRRVRFIILKAVVIIDSSTTGGETIMKCPYITGKYRLSCTAHGKAEVYVPSLFELEEYCKNTRHSRCPLRNQAYEGQRSGGDTAQDSALRW